MDLRKYFKSASSLPSEKGPLSQSLSSQVISAANKAVSELTEKKHGRSKQLRRLKQQGRRVEGPTASSVQKSKLKFPVMLFFTATKQLFVIFRRH